MKKNIVIIVLSALLIISISIIIISGIMYKKNTSKLTRLNDEIITNYDIQEKYIEKALKDREKKIKEAEKIKDDNRKAKEYKIIINEDTKLIDECIKDKKVLKEQLDKTNEKLKSVKRSKNNLTMFVLFGIDKDIEFDLYTGIKYQRALYTSNIVNVYLGGGAGIKLYDKLGGCITLDISISF